MSRPPNGRLIPALVLFATLFVIYNSNGREIGGIDSQPAKFAARALVLEGTLSVDRDVARQPQYAERPSFARDQSGHFRSAYSPVGQLFGAATAWVLSRVAGVDLDAPLAPSLIAVLTASLLTAAAVALVYLTLLELTSARMALLVAVGLGLGTNYWGGFSRTLGQHEVVAFGLALTLYGWTRPAPALRGWALWLGAIGLALAVTARLQTAPAVVVLSFGLIVRAGGRRAIGPLLLVSSAVAALLLVQVHWFGHPLGAVPVLERQHPVIHHVAGSLSPTPWTGAAGLLVSPNRGLFIYSPVVLIALAGIPAALRRLRDRGAVFLLLAALAQFLAYSLYSVWWGGHGYGPRYALDAVVLLTPAAAVALTEVCTRPWSRTLCAAALVWSVVAAGTGAFFADRWTSDANVDEFHERLWDWKDEQILRAWEAGLSPQNFSVFDRAAVRQVR